MHPFIVPLHRALHHSNAPCTTPVHFQCPSASRLEKSYAPRIRTVGKTGAERLRESLERKKQKTRERNARFYEKNKEKILKERKPRRRKRPRVTAEEQREGKLPKIKLAALQSSSKGQKKARKREDIIQDQSCCTKRPPRNIC